MINNTNNDEMKNKKIKEKDKKIRKNKMNTKKNKKSIQICQISSDKQQQNSNEIQNCIDLQENSTLDYFTIDKYYLYKIKNDSWYNIKPSKQSVFISVFSQQQTLQINGQLFYKYTISNRIICKIIKIKHKIQDQIQKHQINKDIYNNISKQQTFILSNSILSVQQTTNPWDKLPKCLQSKQSVMIIGTKNTGKSTLCQYLINKNSDILILDCDLGQNRCLEGSISLSNKQYKKILWIGEFSPLNNIQRYLLGIKYLYQLYRSQFFGKKLIINTMGYLTGLGQLLIYQIYQIIKPKNIIIMHDEQFPIKIKQNILSGFYIQKIYFNKHDHDKTSTKFSEYNNKFSISKKKHSKFQRMFYLKNHQPNNIVQLIQLFMSSHLPMINDKLNIVQFDNINFIKQQKNQNNKSIYVINKINNNLNMKIVILGDIIDSEQSLFQVKCLGYVFKDNIYYRQNVHYNNCLVDDNIDFQKKFYHLNEKQMIDLQLKYGKIQYLIAQSKTLGNKNMRNNASKNA